jgi:hypothetical protein
MMLAFINEIGQELEGTWASSLRYVRIPLCEFVAVRKNSFDIRSNSTHCVAFIRNIMLVQHFLLDKFNVHRIYT